MPAGVSAYVPIANITISTSQNSVTFSSISQIYTDLIIVLNLNTASPGGASIRFNGDTGSNYPFIRFGANSGQTTSQAGVDSIIGLVGFPTTANNFEFNSTVQIMGYSQTNKNKTVLARSNQPTATQMTGHVWQSNTAITSLRIFTDQNMVAGSTMAIYGISG
jgi:hypothetical protein